LVFHMSAMGKARYVGCTRQSEVSSWPSGTILRGLCKTRDEITKHRDHFRCSFPFKQNLALVRSSELTLLRFEISCLPQKTSTAQAVVAQASTECLNTSLSPLTQRDAPQEHRGSILAATTTTLFQSGFSPRIEGLSRHS